MRLEPLQLLVNGLHLGLALGGNSGVDGYFHLTPPVMVELPRLPMTMLEQESNSSVLGRPDPNGVGHADVPGTGVWSSTGVVS